MKNQLLFTDKILVNRKAVVCIPQQSLSTEAGKCSNCSIITIV